MSEEDFEALKKDMEKQGERLRESLAEALGGDPKDYLVENIADKG